MFWKPGRHCTEASVKGLSRELVLERVRQTHSGRRAARAIATRVGPHGRVIAVDISPGMLDQARTAAAAAGLANIALLCGDATDLRSVPAASIDAVVCAAGLLYMPVAAALLEWARVLKPGGVVTVSTMRYGSRRQGASSEPARGSAAGRSRIRARSSALRHSVLRRSNRLASLGFR